MFHEPHLAPRAVTCQPLTPLSFLARAVDVYAERPAVAWRTDIWTYAEFNDLVARMAHWLRDQGVGPGDVVSVMATNRPELLAAHYAVPALGAVLNTVNTRLDTEEVRYILEHGGSSLLLVDPTVAVDPSGIQIPVHVLCSGADQSDGVNFFSGDAPALDLLAAVHDENQPIALNYTSGTTGRPKGVVYTHRGAQLNATSNLAMMHFTPETRYLWTLPMFHCNGWTHTWALTAAGGLHVCLDKVDPALIVQTIAERAVTHMCCAPVVLYMLLDHMKASALSRVRVGTGGATPTPALLAGLDELGFDLTHLYGLTESYGPATINDPGPHGPPDVAQRARLLARQGRRHCNTGKVAVVGVDGAVVPDDGETVGEIVLRGNTLMAGYYRDPEATEKAFAGGVFHTGDLAVMHPDGQIEIRDRAKDIIISGGENFSSLEVESVLHHHPDILLAAVVAAPHEKWGETGWAFVETRGGKPIDTEALDAFCRARLAGFKRPRRFIVGPLPKTATGKIQKFQLREQAKEMATHEQP
ncbi:Long-chain-fatty-acid--CoA ligase [Ruegeria sp. THAF57]|uniref:AMP-binding protein n=1 Tax=Ruegeria sp. THAF57 TaxID=2744555 RepID=UPI0015DDC74A|nr:AMP-binding protein [Ruegeria sp. THAF57]CAD0187251.1 Long-chain-fatty-acid--CoA ligase [Ruegeria sp. THAF57]